MIDSQQTPISFEFEGYVCDECLRPVTLVHVLDVLDKEIVKVSSNYERHKC